MEEIPNYGKLDIIRLVEELSLDEKEALLDALPLLIEADARRAEALKKLREQLAEAANILVKPRPKTEA